MKQVCGTCEWFGEDDCQCGLSDAKADGDAKACKLYSKRKCVCGRPKCGGACESHRATIDALEERHERTVDCQHFAWALTAQGREPGCVATGLYCPGECNAMRPKEAADK